MTMIKSSFLGISQNSPTDRADLFQYILFPLLTQLLSMAILALLFVLTQEKRISFTYLELLCLVIILVVLALITAYPIYTKKERVIKAYQHLFSSITSLVIFIIFFIAGTVVLLFFFSMLIPPFQITSPGTNTIAGPSITVSGNGAIPGSPVSVWVIDDMGRQWDQGQSIIPTDRGEWIGFNISIGREGNDIGKEFKIFAKTRNKEGQEISSKSITVIRK